MKKFKFTMEPLLRIRKIEENKALAGLAKVLTHVNRMEEQKTEAKSSISEEINLFSRKKNTETNFDDYRMHYRYMDRLDREIADAEKKIQELRPSLEREQAKVTDARKRYRVVEILKERKKEEFDLNLKKKEKKDLEEIKRMSGSPERTGFNLFGADEKKEKFRAETDEYDVEEEFESDENTKTEKGDALSEYFKEYGMQDPRKKK